MSVLYTGTLLSNFCTNEVGAYLLFGGYECLLWHEIGCMDRYTGTTLASFCTNELSANLSAGGYRCLLWHEIGCMDGFTNLVIDNDAVNVICKIPVEISGFVPNYLIFDNIVKFRFYCYFKGVG